MLNCPEHHARDFYSVRRDSAATPKSHTFPKNKVFCKEINDSITEFARNGSEIDLTDCTYQSWMPFSPLLWQFRLPRRRIVANPAATLARTVRLECDFGRLWVLVKSVPAALIGPSEILLWNALPVSDNSRVGRIRGSACAQDAPKIQNRFCRCVVLRPRNRGHFC